MVSRSIPVYLKGSKGTESPDQASIGFQESQCHQSPCLIGVKIFLAIRSLRVYRSTGSLIVGKPIGLQSTGDQIQEFQLSSLFLVDVG